MSDLQNMPIDDLCVNTIRTLAMDGVQKANSGHPGTPMALAPLAYVLWASTMRYNPKNPKWIDRDRFVLSAGHASMLQYAALHLAGFGVSLDDLKSFRQWGSITPGHPENHITPGIETTTGPLGQGVMNSVGMAMAEAHLAAVYNRPGHEVINHHTYAICSDGDLMEGASHEAASVAGHLGLGKLIWIYDDNHISIEGPTELALSDDAQKRFEAYQWHVINLGEKANDLDALRDALEAAKNETDRPTLIIVRSHIAWGAPTMQDTPESHGAPLGDEEIRNTKKFYGFPENETFLVHDRVYEHMKTVAIDRGAKLEADWNQRFDAYKKAHPDAAAGLASALTCELPQGWEKHLPVFKAEDGPVATRKASAKVINSVAEHLPWLIGGSADLSPSTNTLMKCSKYFAKGSYDQRNLAWGIRELTMCASSSGMALHGGMRPYAATFFVFTDYARPAIRLAALMNLPVIYVMTHDSIGLGEDGPTHQPVEHLAALRAIPQLCVIRPSDANETAQAWRAALLRRNGPTMIVLTRQNLPTVDRARFETAEGLLKGAYVLSGEKGAKPDVILIATGSEVSLIVEAQSKLAEKGVDARVISMPSWELFEEQPEKYRNEVIPPDVKARLAVEAGASFGWCRWVGNQGDVIGIDKFGASAPAKENFLHYGFTVDNVVAHAAKLAGK